MSLARTSDLPLDIGQEIQTLFDTSSRSLYALAKEKKTSLSSFQQVFETVVGENKDIFSNAPKQLLFLFALLLNEIKASPAHFIAHLNITCYTDSPNAGSRDSFYPRPSELADFLEAPHTKAALPLSHSDAIPVAQNGLPIVIQHFDDEEQRSVAIRQEWLNYFNREGIAHLTSLLKLHLAYNEWNISTVATKYLFLKEVSCLYGQMPFILTEFADGLILDKNKLSWWTTWQMKQLFQALLANDRSSKPVVIIVIKDHSIDELKTFPNGNNRFALDIAYAISQENLPLCGTILASCGIRPENAEKLKTLSTLSHIHPDIQKTLPILARENPATLRLKTEEYIELASIVYHYSLIFFTAKNSSIINFMAQRGFYGTESAPPRYFVTESPDRLVALLFIAIAYEKIRKNNHQEPCSVFNHLLINVPLLTLDCVYSTIVQLPAFSQLKKGMENIIIGDKKSAMTKAIAFFKQSNSEGQFFMNTTILDSSL